MPAVSAKVTAAGRSDDGRLLASGLAALDGGRPDQALAEAEQLLSGAQSHGAGLVLLGFAGLLRNQPALALEALLAAHEEQPASPLIAEALAILYAVGGEIAEATYFAKLAQANGLDDATLACFPKAWPGFAAALLAIRERPFHHKGVRALEAHEPALAASFFEAQLAFRPNDGQSLRALADCRLALGQPRRAGELLSRFTAQAADARDLSRLSLCLAQSGAAAQAAALADEAGRRAPADGRIAAAALVAASYDPAATGDRLRDLGRARYASLLPAVPLTARAPLPEGGLRLGLLLGNPLDGDLLASVAAFAEGCRSLDGVVLIAFGDGPLDQACHAPLQGRIDQWIDVGRFDPMTLGVVVRGEAVDVLLDAGGLTAPLSGAALSHHPAPLCIAWAGQPVALPGPGVDLLLSAPGLDADAPEAPLAICTAGLIAPFGVVAAAPRERGDELLFGADLAPGQLHDDLLDAWAALLAALPQARLVLRDREFSHPDAVADLVARAGARGIAEQIELMAGSRAAFAAAVDLLLAPFAALDGFDALTALAAGRPVVACAGTGRHRRFAAAVLDSAGLGAWIADSPAAYVALAHRLAQNLDGATACARAAAATLTPERFARGVVEALRRAAA